MDTLAQQLLTAIEKTGIRIEEANREHFLHIAQKMSDSFLNAAITAFANNLPSGGIKSFEYQPIKDAIIASLPEIDQNVNTQLDQLFSQLP